MRRRAKAQSKPHFLRRPIILVPAVAGAAALAGLYYFEHFKSSHQNKMRADSETHGQPAPVPPVQATADKGPQELHAEANPPDARGDSETPTPPKRVPQTRSLIASRDPALDSWFIKAYLHCWTPPKTLPEGEKYGAQVRVVHNPDGSLKGEPVLVNPPSDPAWRAYANSAVRAVSKCNPLQVPSQYASRFDQWRKMTLHFSPETASD